MLLPMISSVTALAFTASICETMAEAEDGFISRRRDAAVSISSVLKILAALCGFMLACEGTAFDIALHREEHGKKARKQAGSGKKVREDIHSPPNGFFF